jgi:hypothetical protein
MTSRSVAFLKEWDEGFRTLGPYATTMNDITYDSYHLFSSQVPHADGCESVI